MTNSSALTALQRLIEIVAQLRSPEGGCPWDLAQTPKTLTPYVLEEAYEVVDAIQRGNVTEISEELGDLLLQVVLQAQIAQEHGQFDLADVASGISDKLVRRHPHVFGDVKVENVEEVKHNWEQIKATEKGEASETGVSLSQKLSRHARTLPPLTATLKISKKAATAGFEWENVEGVWAKFEEELNEFRYALVHEDKAQQQAELGDLLFTVVNLARWYDLDPVEALQGTNRRFIERFSQVEAALERPLAEYSLEELEALWQKAKQKLKGELKQPSSNDPQQ